MEWEIVSVITVCYNCKEFLERTIQSFITQTYQSKELIIVDGGSNDGTLDIIKKYSKYIDKWISEPDEGIYDAMNKGIKLAGGKWLNFMNAGDVFADKEVLHNIFSMEFSSNISFLYSDFWEINGDNSMSLRTASRSKGNINHQASIYKKDLHIRYGLYQYVKPYCVYDLLFFLSIPITNFFKVPYPISISDNTGVSNQDTWCFEEAQGARVAYGIISLHQAYKRYWFQRINQLLPNWLKLLLDRIYRRSRIRYV